MKLYTFVMLRAHDRMSLKVLHGIKPSMEFTVQAEAVVA